MSDLDRLQSLLSSGAACVWIVTDEEEHALRIVRDAAMTADRPICQWDIIRGIRDGLVVPAPAPEEGTEHPAAALYRFSEREDGSICVMLDLIAHLSDERTLRAARDVIGAFESRRERALQAGTLVFIDHRADLPDVLRSSSTRLEFMPPDDPEIESILVSTLRRENQHRPIQVSISKRALASVIQNLRGLSRSQIERTITAAVADDREFSPDDLAGILARKRQILEGEGLLEFVEAPTDMDQIGGLGKLKQWLKERERALSPEASKFGIDAPRGILMLGVQGAGKSLCAKAIATAWKRPLLRLDPGVLYDRYIGESERKLRSALKQAEMMAPAVLWIDEIEKAFASAASRSIDGGLSQRMFGTLLTWMQEHGSGVFLAATANDVEALPPELLRKGRFDEIFFVDLPSEEARRQIFEIHLKKRGRDPKKFDGAALAKAALGFSGAEIEQAVIAGLNRAFNAGKELGMVHVVESIKVSPPLSVTMAERVGDLRKWAVGRCVPGRVRVELCLWFGEVLIKESDMRTTTIMAVAAGAVCSAASAQSFVNGNFETNDLSGWTVENYASGGVGAMGVGAPGSVTSQDIDDTGPLGPSPAATFYTGLASYVALSEGGIEMTQSLVLSAGVSYTVQFDWLAQRQATAANAEGGVFSLVVNGTAVSTVSAGEVVFGAPKHGHVSASFTPSAGGAHTVGIRITRPYVQPGETSQHVDNVTISAGSTPCYANCDASTNAPILNVNDFTCFLNRFAAGFSSANCDGSTTAPTLNVNDFTCFLNLYAAGC